MTNDGTRPSRTFRIFVSSTFEDFKDERNALQRYVFPRLQELCAQRQGRFQAIDLRWGVSEEAGLDQRAVEICLDEIARCQRLTPRPNFIVLLGDRYGWRPLPSRIEKTEFKGILAHVSDAGGSESDRALLLWTGEQPKDHQGWYRLDENADPLEYVLLPREVVVPEGATADVRTAAQEAEETRWRAIEGRLRAILLAAIDKLGWKEDDARRAKYVASATEQEIVRGVLEPLGAAEHVFGFSRTILTQDGKPLAEHAPADSSATRFVDELEVDRRWVPDLAAHDRLVALKNTLGEVLGKNLLHYEANWTSSGITTDHIGALPHPDAPDAPSDPLDSDHPLDNCLKLLERTDLPRTLCNDVWRKLAGMILGQFEQIESEEAVEAEIDAHERFGADRCRHFVGRTEPLGAIATYLAASEPQPLAVVGEPGSGKSALMARAVEQAQAAHPKAITVVRFIGATPGSSDGRTLLGDLCRQITRSYGADESSVPIDYNDLAVDFPRRLEFATAARPLIVFLDALDQLGTSDPARALTWLPVRLPDHVRLVVSTLPGDCEAALRSRRPGPGLVELRAMQASEAEELLGLWLEEAGRALQDRHREEVLGKFALCGLPLYLKLAFEEARLWHSYSDSAQIVLSEGIPALISQNLFGRLTEPASHGELLVSHALGYLAASRYGLSEDELLDVLSEDGPVKEDFLARSPRSPKVDRLPVVVWSRLYFDLEPYLSEHVGEGTTLLAFYHRQLGEAATKQFLAGDEGLARHTALATYFRARADPSADRTWTGDSVRGLSELPYHLTHAERWAEVYDTLTDFCFLEQKAAKVGITTRREGDERMAAYAGVFGLQDDFDTALRYMPGGEGEDSGRRRLIVTAVDLGEGLTVRCPHCNKVHPYRAEWCDHEINCPNPDCNGPLKVNPFVVERSRT